MLQGICQKIKFQLNSQGFNRIADFVNQAGTNYFMEDNDPSRLERLVGCRSTDQTVLEENHITASKYHLDDAFFSKILATSNTR